MASHRDSRDPSQRRERGRSWLEDALGMRRRDEDTGARERGDRSERHGQGAGGDPRDPYRQRGYGAPGPDDGRREREMPRGLGEADDGDRDFSVRSPYRQREYAPGWQGDDRFYTGVFSGSGADPDFRSGGGRYEVEDWGSHMGWGAGEPRHTARGGGERPRSGHGGERGLQHGDEDRSRAFAQPRRGGFRGLGPKNYARSDQRISDDLCERLTDDDEIDARGIEVRVSDGVVTLSGTVADRAMKHRAEDLAERCAGVRDVENRIRVSREEHASGQSGARSRPGGDSRP
jgi:hypothetical protein